MRRKKRAAVTRVKPSAATGSQKPRAALVVTPDPNNCISFWIHVKTMPLPITTAVIQTQRRNARILLKLHTLSFSGSTLKPAALSRLYCLDLLARRYMRIQRTMTMKTAKIKPTSCRNSIWTHNFRTVAWKFVPVLMVKLYGWLIQWSPVHNSVVLLVVLTTHACQVPHKIFVTFVSLSTWLRLFKSVKSVS